MLILNIFVYITASLYVDVLLNLTILYVYSAPSKIWIISFKTQSGYVLNLLFVKVALLTITELYGFFCGKLYNTCFQHIQAYK